MIHVAVGPRQYIAQAYPVSDNLRVGYSVTSDILLTAAEHNAPQLSMMLQSLQFGYQFIDLMAPKPLCKRLLPMIYRDLQRGTSIQLYIL